MATINYDNISFNTLTHEANRILKVNEEYRKRIKELKASQELVDNTVSEEKETINIESDDAKEIDEEEQLEILEAKENADNEMNYYLENYCLLSDGFSRDDFFSILPSPKHERYEEIMMRLHAESLKRKNDIRDLLSLDGDFSKEELVELKTQLIKEDKKIGLIREEQQAKDSDGLKREIKNNIIVDSRILEEIKNIESGAYPHFIKLFDSIIDGTFKNVKTFNNNIDGFGGISQVKFYQSRIGFKKIDNHNYAIVTCFIKKDDMAKHYIETYRNKITDFNKNYLDDIKKEVNNLDFILNNEIMVNELYRIIGNNQKEEGKGK